MSDRPKDHELDYPDAPDRLRSVEETGVTVPEWLQRIIEERAGKKPTETVE